MRYLGASLLAATCLMTVATVHSQNYQTTSSSGLTAGDQEQLSFTPASRLARANASFQRQVNSFPDLEANVTASFTQPRPIREVVEEAQAYGLTIQGFRHGDASSSGGYTMTPGEDLESALRQYQHDLKFFPQLDLQLTEQMLASEKDAKLVEALQARKKDLIARQQQQEKAGFVIVGIDLRGRGTALKRFAAEKPFVLVVELRDGGRRNAAIFPDG